MDLMQIAVFCFGALIYNFVLPATFPPMGADAGEYPCDLLVTTQPRHPIFGLLHCRHVTIAVTVIGWYLTRPQAEPDNEGEKVNHIAHFCA